jgi:hypothetical protein
MARLDFTPAYFTLVVKPVRHGHPAWSPTKEERAIEATRKKELRQIWRKRKFKTERAAEEALARLVKRFPGVAGWYEVTEAMDLCL